MAYWCKGNEKQMLENCQQRVKYCTEQIGLLKTRLQETEIRWKSVDYANPFAEMTWGEPKSR